MLDMPYFMTDQEWFYFDFEDGKWKLTDKAPDDAKQSYAEYMTALEGDH